MAIKKENLNKIPTDDVIQKAGEVKIFDSEGKELLFKSLYANSSGEHKRVMVIFIRHFFCGVCQDYVKALAAGIPTSSLPKDLSIVIVGCGAASLVPSYAKEVSAGSYPYPIYANPTKELYGIFEMKYNLEVSSQSPDYQQGSIFSKTMGSAWQLLKRTTAGDAFSGGPFSLNGGEFLFEVGGGDMADDKVEVTWCSIMANTMDHTSIEALRKVLKLE